MRLWRHGPSREKRKNVRPNGGVRQPGPRLPVKARGRRGCGQPLESAEAAKISRFGRLRQPHAPRINALRESLRSLPAAKAALDLLAKPARAPQLRPRAEAVRHRASRRHPAAMMQRADRRVKATGTAPSVEVRLAVMRALRPIAVAARLVSPSAHRAVKILKADHQEVHRVASPSLPTGAADHRLVNRPDHRAVKTLEANRPHAEMIAAAPRAVARLVAALPLRHIGAAVLLRVSRRDHRPNGRRAEMAARARVIVRRAANQPGGHPGETTGTGRRGAPPADQCWQCGQ
jgi:hypothetical protein